MPPKGPVNCACANCGQGMHRNPALLKSRTNHYCSVACMSAHKGRVVEEKAATEVDHTHCLHCGVEMTHVIDSKHGRKFVPHKKFCSHSCAAKAQRRHPDFMTNRQKAIAAEREERERRLAILATATVGNDFYTPQEAYD